MFQLLIVKEDKLIVTSIHIYEYSLDFLTKMKSKTIFRTSIPSPFGRSNRFFDWWPFLAVFGHFWPFLAIFGRFWPFLPKKNVGNHVIYLSFMAHYWGNLSLCKKSAKMCTKLPFLVILAIFGHFGPFFFCHFWAVLGRF